MPSNGRPPGGNAEAGLAGMFPTPALGLPHAAGLFLSDDFYTLGNWTTNTIGAAPTTAAVAPGGWDEAGVQRVTTTAVNGQGGVLSRAAAADIYRIPPPGSKFAVKLRVSTGALSYDMWSGFASSVAAGVRQSTDATQFIGVRVDRAVGGNIYGVVKDGAGAANENAVDLGLSPESSNWVAVGFDVEGTTAAPSVQFYVYSLSRRDVWAREAVGSPITTHIPATTLYSVGLGIITRAGSSRAADVDWWNLGGRVARMP